MKLIERNEYLQKLVGVMGTPDIKVITGVRRSGKSKLLEAFRDYVMQNVPNANVIHINFNLAKFEEYKDYHALHDCIEKSFKKGCENFVLIDEVQMCPSFELTINSIHAMELFDIYITGSNAFLLSSDLATLFTGRTHEIRVYPFSFAEFKQYFGLEDNYAAFDRYVKEGGMAGSYLYRDQEAQYDYIRDVFDTLIIRDIRQKYKIRNPGLMDRIVDYLLDNISNQTSARNITDVLARNNEKISHKTVGSYLEYLCNAFAFYRFRRYDIRGKKYLSSNDKYYLSDHAFRYAKLGTKNMDYGRVLENITAMELMRRGYEVYVGVLYNKEIDFVAIRRSEKIYIQVSDNISDEKTFEREVGPLLRIKDAYPKMVIARTRNEAYQYEGIRIVDIADWLSD
ncbi:ATP-binding protein [Bifidobacterium panos]|uniref:ATPase n=1 Tax=Bifidobacterium panos TaxID=2675321 RepID=A0ABX1SXD6_9BIFI|nr:ATP-binding protein [Bifidobacterium sp. DSM 109963]NMN02508.1 ATPase [Bifidobacterium sp. DSM 109963]